MRVEPTRPANDDVSPDARVLQRYDRPPAVRLILSVQPPANCAEVSVLDSRGSQGPPTIPNISNGLGGVVSVEFRPEDWRAGSLWIR